MLTHQLWVIFDWPDGIVVGNLLASFLWVPIAALGIFCFRDRIGPRLIAWFHRHHQAHLDSLERDADG